ncbi:MAG: PEP-utilizing enzyme [Candidatus Woesearchaeota archaeon]
MNIKQVIKDMDWYKFHERLRSPFFHQIFLPNMAERDENIPFDNRFKNFGSFLNHVAVDKKELESFSDRTVIYLKKNPNYLLELMEQGYKNHNEALKEWKGMDKNFASKSNKELAKIFKKYVERLLSFQIYVALPLLVEDYMEQEVKEAFEKIFGDKASYWFGVAVNPVKDATILKEEIAILDLAKKSFTDEDVERLVDSFSWMKNTGYFEEYYTKNYYISRIEEAKKNNKEKEMLEAREKNKKEFSKLLDSIKDEYILALVKTINEAVYFRSYRTEMFYSSARFFSNLFKEVASRISVADYKEILWLFWEEIYGYLVDEKEADLELIEKRKKGYAFVVDPQNKFWSWEGKAAEEIFEYYQKDDDLSKGLTEVKGSTGFPGKVVGRAAVLFSLDEKSKIKKGDVLIVHTTNVDLVPILGKVSAIVTEEGGILSHASIISRELMIPCVIGTKVATKVFKDGDKLEVDAENGVVRKI